MIDIEQLKEKTNYVSITGIIRKKENGHNRYLICKRSPNEKAFPNKWCVPGGKIEQKDFINTTRDTADHWLDIFEKTLKKEILEETNLTIINIGYVSSLVFIRPNGFSTIIVSLYADYDSGEIKLSDEELVDYAWVDTEE
ncbi:MAG: NUDIX domain-containing protein, partial [Candidatus Woesearchaeota archaeon]